MLINIIWNDVYEYLEKHIQSENYLRKL